MKFASVFAVASAALLALSATGAQAGWMPEPPPEAWVRWNTRAEAIVGAAEHGTAFASACEGVRGEFIKAPMPMWSQGMINLCDAVRSAQNGQFICTAVDKDYNCTAEAKGVSPFERKHICMNANAALRALKGVKPADISPETYDHALKLIAIGQGVKGFYHCL